MAHKIELSKTIHLLGEILGLVIKEQEGISFFNLVEKVRKLSKANKSNKAEKRSHFKKIRKINDKNIMNKLSRTSVVIGHYLGRKKTYLEIESNAD